MSREVALTREEREARARVEGLGNRYPTAFAAVSNVFRVANAVRNYMERNLLAEYRLSFSGFTVLWVLWVWGPKESHVLAEESGISKSTLTGVVKTLEGLGFAVRRPHAADGRRVLVGGDRDGDGHRARDFSPLQRARRPDHPRPLHGGEGGARACALRVMLHTVGGLTAPARREEIP